MSTFYAILTEAGEAKIANAHALGETLLITHMAVGDGNGEPTTPDTSQTALVNERRRAQLNTLNVDPQNPSAIIAEQVIPESVGGWWIRELGLFDEAGDLIAVANCPDTYKPVLAEGSGRTQVIRMVLVVSSAASVELKIDPAVVLATRAHVNAEVLEVANALGAHIGGVDPHPQYLTKQVGNQRYLQLLDEVPAVEVAALIYVPPYGVMVWSATHGIYRAVECGQLAIHTAPTAKPGTVKANGGVLSKAAYAGLWSQAQDDGLVVTAGNWLAGNWRYEDVDEETFRVPDVRGEFLRMWDDGRGVDTARAFGSHQMDALQNITGTVFNAFTHANMGYNTTGAFIGSNNVGLNSNIVSGGNNDYAYTLDFDASNVVRAAAETRSRSTALTPCIHI